MTIITFLIKIMSTIIMLYLGLDCTKLLLAALLHALRPAMVRAFSAPSK